MTESELYHYGVVGMKWGVRRATSKSYRNEKLLKKAYKYDKKSAVNTKKSEKIHNKEDLERSNKAAIKSAKYAKKAAVMRKKALKTENEAKEYRLNKKASNLDYKSAAQKQKANRISKTEGYGLKAMKYSVKSDRFAKKAAKARKKVAANESYIAMTKRRANNLPPDKMAKGQAYIDRLKDL